MDDIGSLSLRFQDAVQRGARSPAPVLLYRKLNLPGDWSCKHKFF
jgi:hypothetical protein